MNEKNIYVGGVNIKELFKGDMGIKQAYVGETLIYERPGGFFYLELNTTNN